MPNDLMSGGRPGAGLQYNWTQDRRLIFGAVGAALLLVGAFATGLEIGFYTFERWYICLVSAFVAYSEGKRQRPVRLLIAVSAAILFNPFVPILLTRGTWFPADLAVAAWLGWIAIEGLAYSKHRSILVAYPLLLIVFVGLLLQQKPYGSAAGPNMINIDTNMTTENVTTNDVMAEEMRQGDIVSSLPPAAAHPQVENTAPSGDAVDMNSDGANDTGDLEN